MVILVIDDDRELCEGLAEYLSIQGYAVQYATNGREALRLLADSQNRPALVLLDLMMPVLDGWGFLAARRRDPRLADLPVIILSGCHDVTQTTTDAVALP